jgi:hypothetical protein
MKRFPYYKRPLNHNLEAVWEQQQMKKRNGRMLKVEEDPRQSQKNEQNHI